MSTSQPRIAHVMVQDPLAIDSSLDSSIKIPENDVQCWFGWRTGGKPSMGMFLWIMSITRLSKNGVGYTCVLRLHDRDAPGSL